MKFRLYTDFGSWALPLHIEFSQVYFSVQILVWTFASYHEGEQKELTPECELEQLNMYTDEVMSHIAEERADIMKRMGGVTTSG